MKYTKAFLLFTFAILLTGLEVSAQDARLMTAEQRGKLERDNRLTILSNLEKFNRGEPGRASEDWSDDLTNHGEKVGRAGIKLVLEDGILLKPTHERMNPKNRVRSLS